MKIYLASSWRNEEFPAVRDILRKAGHEVYDFRDPPSKTAFKWSDIDPNYKEWGASEYVAALKHPVAEGGFKSDMGAMEWADVCVLLLPSGRSAHLEAGWFAGKGKPVFILTRHGEEPELMAKMCTAVCWRMSTLLGLLDNQSGVSGL